MTTFRWYLLGILALFGAYVALEYYRPKPLDWSPTLSRKDKIPYGTYALFDVLPEVLGTDSVADVRLPIFNQLLDAEEPRGDRPTNVTYANDSTDVANDESAAALEAAALPLVATRAQYIFINQEFTASQLEARALRRFVAQGHDVFIAAEDFQSSGRGGSLADSLGVRAYPADSTLTRALDLGAGGRDSVALRLLGAGAPARPFWFSAAVAGTRLALTKRPAHRGATLAADAQGRPVLLRLDYGRGHFYLCSVPLAFGNYWLLRPRTAGFALATLSALPAGRPVWWDEYQKQGRTGEQSVLRVVLAHPALRTAYYLLLGAGLLFVLVEARRRQRIIPIIRPLPNTTLLFTRTVAGLYRQGRNHAQIAEKKTALFLDFLRVRFQEPTPDLADEAFRERLSQKAGLPRPRVDELVRLINFARTAPAVTDRELLILSRAIQDFKRETR